MRGGRNTKPRPDNKVWKIFSQGLASRPALILLCAIVVAVALRTTVSLRKAPESLAYDEAISYLAATGYQGTYNRARDYGDYPFGQWVQAAEWKQFRIPKASAFNEIRRDLAQFDIHPPLYFWLLHLWFRLFGVRLWTGPFLNVFIDLVALLCLWRLAAHALNNRLEASFVAFTWAASPAVVIAASYARQYSLYALCTILFVWLIIKYAGPARERPPLKMVLLLAITTAAGALTHYHFVLVITGCLLFLTMRFARSDRSRLLAAIVAIGAGYLLFIILHPSFYLSIRRLASRQGLEALYLSDPLSIYQRIYATISTFSGFLVHGRTFEFIFFSMWLAFLIWLALVYFKNRARIVNRIRQVNLAGGYILFFFLWLSGITLLLYFTFLSPIHAMSPRHLSSIWPFYAFVPILGLRFLPEQRRTVVTTIFCLVVLLFGSAAALLADRVRDQKHLSALLAGSSLIVVDTVEEGILTRVLWTVPDHKLIFAADQSYLLQNQGNWLDRLDDRAIYVSDLSYRNTPEQRDQILALIDQIYGTEQLQERLAGTAVYRLERKERTGMRDGSTTPTARGVSVVQ